MFPVDDLITALSANKTINLKNTSMDIWVEFRYSNNVKTRSDNTIRVQIDSVNNTSVTPPQLKVDIHPDTASNMYYLHTTCTDSTANELLIDAPFTVEYLDSNQNILKSQTVFGSFFSVMGSSSNTVMLRVRQAYFISAVPELVSNIITLPPLSSSTTTTTPSPVRLALQFAMQYFGMDPKYKLNGTFPDTMHVNKYVSTNVPNCGVNMLLHDRDQYFVTKRMFTTILCDFLYYLRSLPSEVSKVLYVHFSGHGISLKTGNKSEDNLSDEFIVLSNGFLLDSVLTYLLQSHIIVPNLYIFFVSDSCHSGHLIQLNIDDVTDASMKNNLIVMSGCLDNQTSGEDASGGFMTTSLLKTVMSPSLSSMNVERVHDGVCNEMINVKRLSQYSLLSTNCDISKVSWLLL